jgi:predicted nucleotidyltransferase
MVEPAPKAPQQGAYLAPDDARREQVASLLRNAGILLAVVHGSRARGGARPGSDLDVGLLARNGQPLSYASMGLIALDLSQALGLQVDASDLATADAIFRFEVAGCARPLFEADPHAFTDFVGKTLVDYSDIQRFLPELVAGVARGRSLPRNDNSLAAKSGAKP